MACAIQAAADPAVRLGNPIFDYGIAADGRNIEFTDRVAGRNYLRPRETSSCASVRRGGKEYSVTEVSMSGGRLFLRFGGSDIEAHLKVESRPECVVLTVEAVKGDVESLTFLNVPLALEGRPTDPFGACVLSLNMLTRVDALPALQRELRASAEKKFGLIGAKAAIVAAPMDQMLFTLQETLAASSQLPLCRVAGPWAHAIPFNHGSYLFNFGLITETNIDDWIEMTRRVGFDQIDNHGGGAFFRFGDFELNRAKWPDGWDGFGRIVARLHKAGIGSIFHTYAFFIDKRSRYVAPVPDKRLDAFRTFTLAEPVSADATEIAVDESTADMSTVTGFFVHNSVVLHLDDELVVFEGVTKQSPWRFTGVKRGAHGTRASTHARGTRARHLKECFGLFVPNPESSLFEEIAANHADIVNRCGFDGIYLDAIDGSSILRGPDECWFWAGKFVVEIQKRLKKPVGMEMSAMWHHFWQYRTRWQAWDYPQRGHKRFIDIHANEVNGGLLLPLHLGWWSFQSFDPPQIEPSYPDVIEHLGARLIGWDAGISLTAAVDRGALQKTPLFARAVDTLRTCEELRRTDAFDATTKARLRDPHRQFALYKTAEGKARFQEIDPHAQTISMSQPWSCEWTLTNTFAAQPPRIRIEALASVATSQSNNAVLLADLAMAPSEQWKTASANGVSCAVRSPTDSGKALAWIIATNTGRVPRNAAWTRLEKRFDPPLDAGEAKGLGIEIETDAPGALLAIRLESPQHLAFGAVADRYIDLDFTGRRAFTLVETESSRWSDLVWNDGKHAYNVYRETINFGAVESVSVWLHNLPPNHQTRVGVGRIYALPMRAALVRNPKLTANGHTIMFPVDLQSGCWIEGNDAENCMAYGPNGEPLGKVTPRGDWPRLQPGANPIAFGCEDTGKITPRARVTIFSVGQSL